MASQFKKLNKDILLEWNYDDNNTIFEDYQILTNQKDSSLTYIGSDPSFNTLGNQLFLVDPVQNKWSKIDVTKYSFLKLNISGTSEVVNDEIKIHLPVNYDFNEYRGFLISIYTYDYDNKKFCYLSNFFFDKFDSPSSLRTTIAPPLLYEDRLWNSEITFNIPAVRHVSLQRTSGQATTDSVNYNLSNGRGLSLTAPIFIDFRFITGVQQVGSLKNYLTNTPYSIEISRTEELEELDRGTITTNLTLVRVGVPHAIIMNDFPRWSISARGEVIDETMYWKDITQWFRNKNLLIERTQGV